MAAGQKTGGRKAGTPNKASAAKAAAIAASGLTPVDYMLSVMRDENAAPEVRLGAARAAAPYVHRRLSSVAYSGPEGGPIEMAIEDRVCREERGARIGRDGEVGDELVDPPADQRGQLAL